MHSLSTLQINRDMRLSVLIRPCCMLLIKASSRADWLIPASSTRYQRKPIHETSQDLPMSLKLLPILGVPSLPSFRDRGPFDLGLPNLPSSARWLEARLIGLFAAD